MGQCWLMAFLQRKAFSMKGAQPGNEVSIHKDRVEALPVKAIAGVRNPCLPTH
jgi:hypothetical protein